MKRRCFAHVILILTIFISFLQASTTYTIDQVASGAVPGLSVSTKGNEHSNLGLTLRFISSAPISCTIEIPAGTIFSAVPLAKSTAGARANGGSQSMLSPYRQYASLLGGSLPKKTGAGSAGYYYDRKITALCMDIDLPPPDTATALPAVISRVSESSHLKSFIDSIAAFHSQIGVLHTKIEQGSELSDAEFERVKFLSWLDSSTAGQWRTLAKGCAVSASQLKIAQLLPNSYTLEINKPTIQNALWAMIPEPGVFLGNAVRKLIEQALHIELSGRMDTLARDANAFLCLMGQSRRIYYADSLTRVVSNRVKTPQVVSNSWGGAGGGWCSRISVPTCDIGSGNRWLVRSVSYLLGSSQSGTFTACILACTSKAPGNYLSSRKVVSFSAEMNGSDSWLTVDFSDENIWVSGDFFVALYQEMTFEPKVLMSVVNENRSYAFDGTGWQEDSLSLAFSATLSPSLNSYVKEPSFKKNGAKGIVIHEREGILVFDLSDGSCIHAATLLNLGGQKIWELESNIGGRTAVWSNCSLPSGTYVIRIKGSAGSMSKFFHVSNK